MSHLSEPVGSISNPLHPSTPGEASGTPVRAHAIAVLQVPPGPFSPLRGTWETLRAIVPGPGEPHFQGSKVPSLTSDVAQCGSNIHEHWPARPRGLCFGCKCSTGAHRARTNQPVDPNSPCIVTALYIDKLVGPGTLTGRMELGSDLGTGQAVSCGRYQMLFPLSPTPSSFPLLWEGSPSPKTRPPSASSRASVAYSLPLLHISFSLSVSFPSLLFLCAWPLDNT
jgi:hypothetical protein